MLQELFRIPIPEFLRQILPFLPRQLPLYGYGLMLVIGFLLAIQFGKALCRRSKIDLEIVVNMGLIALVSGIVGARLSHVIENWATYTNPNRSAWDNFIDAINISSGGLTFYGGLILAAPVTNLYILYKKVPLRTAMDIAAPCILIGLGLGRVGCYLNGCCYGAEASSLPWAVHFPYHSPPYIDEAMESHYTQVPRQLLLHPPGGGRELLSVDQLRQMKSIHAQLPTEGHAFLSSKLLRQGGALIDRAYRDAFIQHAATYGGEDLVALARTQHSRWLHPAQLYSTFNALLLAGLLAAYFTLPHVPGRIFALMLILEGATRYLLELLRIEPPVVRVFGHGLSLSMVIGISLVISGTTLWFVFGRLGDGRDPHAAKTAVARAV